MVDICGVCDGDGSSCTPVAQDMNLTVSEDSSIDFIFDVSDPLIYLLYLQKNTAFGMLESNGINATYTPNLNYVGFDSFIYKVVNGLGIESEPALLI